MLGVIGAGVRPGEYTEGRLGKPSARYNFAPALLPWAQPKGGWYRPHSGRRRRAKHKVGAGPRAELPRSGTAASKLYCVLKVYGKGMGRVKKQQ